MTLRQVIKKISADLENEGDGAVVRKSITKIDHGLLDPFVSLVEFSVSPPGGFRDHPHRGFESVTYMLQGGIKYQDFNGYKITIHEGDVQWMTAGKGIIHSEMPAEEVNNGLQLWINLPSTDKMFKEDSSNRIPFSFSFLNVFFKDLRSLVFNRIDPKALELSSSEIPRAEEEGVEVKVIAGESMGVQSPFYTKTPIMFLDFTLKPRAQTHQTVPESWTAFAYVIDGDEGVFSSSDPSTVQAHTVVVFEKGDGVSVLNTSTSRPLRFLLIAGEPIGEPVVQHGPFVINSQAEIDMTIDDYRSAKNGFERAKSWRSE